MADERFKRLRDAQDACAKADKAHATRRSLKANRGFHPVEQVLGNEGPDAFATGKIKQSISPSRPPAEPIRVTPAMEAGVSDHVWSIAEIVGLLDRQPST